MTWDDDEGGGGDTDILDMQNICTMWLWYANVYSTAFLLILVHFDTEYVNNYHIVYIEDIEYSWQM